MCAAAATATRELGFTFTAPPGFTLDNSAQAVFGVKDGGGQALRLDVVRVPADQSLGGYLNSGWIENIDAAHDRGDHHQHASAPPPRVAKGDQWTFRLYAVRFGSDVYRFIFAAKQRTPETDRVFRESVGSFRRLSITEIDRVKPLRLRVVTVAPATRSSGSRAAWRCPTAPPSASACSTASAPATAPSRATGSSSWSSELRKLPRQRRALNRKRGNP